MEINAANWELFKELCHNNMCEMVDDIEDIEEFSKKISEVLRNKAEEVIGKKKNINGKKQYCGRIKSVVRQLGKEIKR